MATLSRAAQFVRAGKLILKARALQQRVNALEDEAKQLLRTKGFLCYGLYGNSSKHIALEVPLQDYLDLFPDVEPNLATWDSGGKRRAKMSYPERWLPETTDGYHIAISSGTEPIVLTEPATASA